MNADFLRLRFFGAIFCKRGKVISMRVAATCFATTVNFPVRFAQSIPPAMLLRE